MTDPQQRQEKSGAVAAGALGALAVYEYEQAQEAVAKHLIALVMRLFRRFGIPLTDSSRKQMADRLFRQVQLARGLSYTLAVRNMEHSAAAAGELLPPVPPIAPYTPDAVVQILERVTEPVEKLTEAEAPTVTIIDRRTGLPIVENNADPNSPRVIYNIGNYAGSAVARHAHQAGRDAVQRTASNAGHEVGWARVTTSLKPCAFCLMLASRGPVYSSDKVALFKGTSMDAYHDGCRCRAELVYRGKPWSGETDYKRLTQMWAEVTKGYSSLDAINAFRRAVYAEQNSPALEAEDAVTDHRTAESGNPSRRALERKTESAADIARRHLPGLEKTVKSLLERGFAEDSPQVQWNRKQIARFMAALN